MTEVIDTLMVQVRGDTQAFATDVADMRGQLDGPLNTSITGAGKKIEDSLAKGIASGKLGFADLEKAALSAFASIAASAVKLGLESIFGGGSGGGGGGGLLSGLTSILGSVFGVPGRAIGGPVSPNQPYMVGENGPELFVPTSAGSIAANGSGGGGGVRDVRVSINVNAPAGTAPDILAASSRQVARAVRSALSQDY